jgi:hypothetical protein
MVGATKGRPYARKDERVQKKTLPRAIYGQIKYKIVAKQKRSSATRGPILLSIDQGVYKAHDTLGFDIT